MINYSILIVDDNPDICEALRLLLGIHGYHVLHCDTPEGAISLLQQHAIALVIQDMNFSEDTVGGEEGKKLFYLLREINPDIPIILITAWAQLETAVELVKDGAADYLSKPWDDAKLLVTITNLVEMHELRLQNQKLNMQIEQERSVVREHDICGLVYVSQNMHNLIEMTLQVAKADIPILITGPNGSGKEKIAEIIQANSSRKGEPFLKVNIGALPIDLMEAELFGAEAGAYTGLNKRRIGRFEAADGGTLFLDEIGNLPMSGQVKLLRVLQTGEFEPLGSHETKSVNVRVISATNANLLQDIKTHDFREDLYYRLNVVELNVPALHQRIADILPLAEFFLDSAKDDVKAEGKTMALETKRALEAYHWPGNVRELQNACQRALVLAHNKVLTTSDFGLEHYNVEEKRPTSSVELSKDDIQRALKREQGNISRAAKSLGLSRQALYRRISKFRIDFRREISEIKK